MKRSAFYISMLAEDIHSVICATVDSKGYPVTRAVDIMLADSETFYFLTARGKAFYEELMKQHYIALTGMTGGAGTMQKKAVSVRGFVRCIGKEKLREIFEKNPYMTEIYPSKKSRQVLEVFTLEQGEGEFFDLSTKPITRETFPVGERTRSEKADGRGDSYFISHFCTGCGKCSAVCPQKCIRRNGKVYEIISQHCLHCGLCFEVCPVHAVMKEGKE